MQKFNRWLIAGLLLCVLVSSANAQQISVEGPESGQVTEGKLVTISVRGKEAALLSYDVHLYNPPIDDSTKIYDVKDGGFDVLFSTGYTGTYNFAIGYSFVEAEVTRTKIVPYVLQVIPRADRPVTPNPNNPNNNNPGQNPTPTPAETLTDFVYKRSLATAFSDPNFKEHVTGMAAAYNAIATKIRNKNLVDVESLKTTQALVNTAILAGDAKHWIPFWKELDTKLASLRMTTMEQHESAWQQIAKGFENASK